MAHGMGAQKDIGLWMYAERFCESGMAVVAFDYRCFGGSTGLPRHWVSPKRHLEDFEAVVQHVKVGGGLRVQWRVCLTCCIADSQDVLSID
jgi:alpha-beta hydrolase superfamily lysophospholipase